MLLIDIVPIIVVSPEPIQSQLVIFNGRNGVKFFTNNFMTIYIWILPVSILKKSFLMNRKWTPI